MEICRLWVYSLAPEPAVETALELGEKIEREHVAEAAIELDEELE